MMRPWFVVVCIAFLLSGCGVAVTPINQKQDSASPNGNYVVSVPIDRADDGHRYWFITIKNTAGELQYRDEAKDFVANLQVYWLWDGADRLWLYSTDTGRVYVWINKEGIWEKNLWGYGISERVYKEAIQPPDELFPHYLKKT